MRGAGRSAVRVAARAGFATRGGAALRASILFVPIDPVVSTEPLADRAWAFDAALPDFRGGFGSAFAA
jgi:hypothetical protein